MHAIEILKLRNDFLRKAKYAKSYFTLQFIGQWFKYILFSLAFFEHLEKDAQTHINPGHNYYISKHNDTVCSVVYPFSELPFFVSVQIEHFIICVSDINKMLIPFKWQQFQT